MFQAVAGAKKGCMVGASLGAFQVQKECWWDWSTEVEG